jgi:hypothetical protein
MSTVPESGGAGSSGLDGGGGRGGFGVGVPGMNNLQDKAARVRMDRTRISFLIFIPFS